MVAFDRFIEVFRKIGDSGSQRNDHPGDGAARQPGARTPESIASAAGMRKISAASL
jgi:hypothetical protein